MSTAGFWDGLYAAAQDGWDLGRAGAGAGRLAGFVAGLVLQALLNAGAQKWPPHSPRSGGHSFCGLALRFLGLGVLTMRACWLAWVSGHRV